MFTSELLRLSTLDVYIMSTGSTIANLLRHHATSTARLLLAMGFLAAKRTPQVTTTGVAWMGKKENAAMPAPGQTGSQPGLGSQNRSQQQIILQHQGGRRAPAIPVRPELKMLLDPDCKKPKLSLSNTRLSIMRCYQNTFCTTGTVLPSE